MELYLVKHQQQAAECGDLSMVLIVLMLIVGFLLIRVYTLHTKLLDIESQHKMLKTLVSITMEEDEKEMFNSIKIDLPTSIEKDVKTHVKTDVARPVTRSSKSTKPAPVVKTVKPTTETFEELKKEEEEGESEYDVEEEEHTEDAKDVIPIRKIKIKKRGASGANGASGASTT